MLPTHPCHPIWTNKLTHMMPSHLSPLLALLTTFLAITSLISLAHGATPPTAQGLSSPSPLNTTRGTTTEPFQIQCTTSLAWFVPLSANDCGSAYSKFLVDVERYGPRTYEFGDFGTPNTTRYRRRRTPRRYRFGDCTIAIALLSSFPRSYLPSPKPWSPGDRWPDTVLGNFRSFYPGLERLITSCDETSSPAGWVRAGVGGDLGLFVFGTDSVVDRLLRDRMLNLATANDTLSFDMTTAWCGTRYYISWKQWIYRIARWVTIDTHIHRRIIFHSRDLLIRNHSIQ